jgi:LmbE family N-acetylglucosaminyl deacetylase
LQINGRIVPASSDEWTALQVRRGAVSARQIEPVPQYVAMPSALAIAAHPDDIEFVMAGTLLLLRDRGWDIHCFNLSTGNMGSSVMSAARTARVRAGEARAAAKAMGAAWYPPICDDLQVFYTDANIRKICSVVREACPRVVLTHALQDYMEDHMITARLAVTATFARGIPNYRSIPARKPGLEPCVIYHAMPHGQRTPTRRRVIPEGFADTTAVHARKRAALACHASQKEWLDRTQGMDSYLRTMDVFSRALGRQTPRFAHAEGWTRHLHYGFGEEDDDPLREVLGARYLVNRAYVRDCERGSPI